MRQRDACPNNPPTPPTMHVPKAVVYNYCVLSVCRCRLSGTRGSARAPSSSSPSATSAACSETSSRWSRWRSSRKTSCIPTGRCCLSSRLVHALHCVYLFNRLLYKKKLKLLCVPLSVLGNLAVEDEVVKLMVCRYFWHYSRTIFSIMLLLNIIPPWFCPYMFWNFGLAKLPNYFALQKCKE